MSTGYNLPCPCPRRSGLNIHLWNASEPCLRVCRFLINIFLESLFKLSPVGCILDSFRGGLGGEVPGLDALAHLACWRNLLLPTSSSGESSFLLLEPRSARSFAIMMFSLAWCSWFLRFDISLCARVSYFFSLANCGSGAETRRADGNRCQRYAQSHLRPWKFRCKPGPPLGRVWSNT
jgi:hypothetical protein